MSAASTPFAYEIQIARAWGCSQYEAAARAARTSATQRRTSSGGGKSGLTTGDIGAR